MADAQGADFNSEVIWDNTKDLFSIYYKDTIVSNASNYAFLPLDNCDTFDFQMKVMGFTII
jgi:hypothetical protein